MKHHSIFIVIGLLTMVSCYNPKDIGPEKAIQANRIEKHIITLASDAFLGRQPGTIGEPTTKKNTPATIDENRLKHHLTVLAHDSLEGRGAGSMGEFKAVSYIGQQFKDIGLDPINTQNKGLEGYLQPFEFYTLEDPRPWNKGISKNVAGILKGSDFPDEYIVVGGHHDGQGLPHQADFGKSLPEGIITDKVAAKKDTIWNSAVDNAVSLATIMEMARVLIQNHVKLKRSIIFIGFGAEENALDGSAFFANNPPVPLQQIKAMINLEKIVGDPEATFLYVGGETMPLFETIRIKTDSLQQVKLAPFEIGIIANTDHYPFVVKKIPSITIGTPSQINIHTSLDHADNMDYTLLKKRSQYILNFLVDLANSEASALRFAHDLSGATGVAGGPATKAEMSSQGYNGARAFKVANIIKGSKGDNAGILPEDLVISVNGKEIKEKPFYQGLEDALGDEYGSKTEVTLKVIRSDNTMNVRLAY